MFLDDVCAFIMRSALGIHMVLGLTILLQLPTCFMSNNAEPKERMAGSMVKDTRSD